MRVPSADRDGRGRGSGSGGTSAGAGSRLISGLTGVPSRLSGRGSRLRELGHEEHGMGQVGLRRVVAALGAVGDVARVGSIDDPFFTRLLYLLIARSLVGIFLPRLR